MGIATQDRSVGGGPRACNDPVVAAEAGVRTTTCGRVARRRKGGRLEWGGWQDRRVVSFALRGQGGFVKRPVEMPLQEFWHRDDVGSTGELPAPRSCTGDRVQGRPRVRPSGDEVVLDGQRRRRRVDQGVHAAREVLKESLGLTVERIQFGPGDLVKPDRSGHNVRVQSLAAEQLGQPSMSQTTPNIHLEQSVLGHRVSVPEKKVGVGRRPYVGDPTVVSKDLYGRGDIGVDHAVSGGYPGRDFFLPP